MKKVYLFFLFIVFIITACTGREKECVISGKVDKADYSGVKVTLIGQGDNSKESIPVEIKEDGSFKISFKIAEPQFSSFNMIFGEGGKMWQSTYRLYIKPGKDYFLKFKANPGSKVKAEVDNKDLSNRALIMYNEVLNAKVREIWTNTPEPQYAKEEVISFMKAAEDCINENAGLDEEVKEYIKVWGFNEYMGHLFGYHSMYELMKKKRFAAPEGFYELIAEPSVYLDNEKALLAEKTVRNIVEYIKYKSGNNSKGAKVLDVLENRINLLKDEFSNPHIIDNVLCSLFSGFKFAYKTSGDFEEDLKGYSSLVHNLQDPKKRDEFIKEFSALRYSMKGSKAPDVVFKDRDGNDVRITDFKGKVVYIDLWASWCGPCCREVPYLQKLEKEYEGRNIVFLSISLDSDKKAWLKKMDELKMHGNQLYIADSGYDKMLNISGIPHFVIYNAEGKLYMSKAPRPSSMEIRGVLNSITEL